MDELADHIQDLPQELYDEIFDLAMHADMPRETNITKSYRPPTALQIDRASRAKYAEEYYATATFRASQMQLLNTWLESLPDVHLTRISNIQYICNEGPGTAVTAADEFARIQTCIGLTDIIPKASIYQKLAAVLSVSVHLKLESTNDTGDLNRLCFPVKLERSEVLTAVLRHQGEVSAVKRDTLQAEIKELRAAKEVIDAENERLLREIRSLAPEVAAKCIRMAEQRRRDAA